VLVSLDGSAPSALQTLACLRQVLISKDESVAGRVVEHVKGLEAEVNVLKHLDHPNIVRYLVSMHMGRMPGQLGRGPAHACPACMQGTDRDQQHLNIFLEFVPGGSIASLLAKFGARSLCLLRFACMCAGAPCDTYMRCAGSFKESVIRVYTRQILLGLEYLHHNKIAHRDIKGANILVDHTGFVKVADFGASKKIEDLVTMGEKRSVSLQDDLICMLRKHSPLCALECRLGLQEHEGHAVLDGARGHQADGARAAGGHLVRRLHRHRDGHRQAALEPVPEPGAHCLLEGPPVLHGQV
jgi:serine/threonine protein kinase